RHRAERWSAARNRSSAPKRAAPHRSRGPTARRGATAAAVAAKTVPCCYVADGLWTWCPPLRRITPCRSRTRLGRTDTYIPWNLVYEEDPQTRASPVGIGNLDPWEPFWGFRYNLGGGRKVDPSRRRPLRVRPAVLLVTDPQFLTPAEKQQLKTTL